MILKNKSKIDHFFLVPVFPDFLTEESAVNMKKDFPELLKKGKILGVDRQLVTKAGEIVDVILSVTMEYDEHGKPIKTRATFEDITDRKKAENKLKLAQKELEIKTSNLEEMNIALKILLKHQDAEKNIMEKNILTNL